MRNFVLFSLRLVTSSFTNRERFNRRIANRPITGAAAKIPGELVIKIIMGLQIVAVISFKQRTDKPRGAVAALRSVTFGHRALHWMHLRRTADSFDAKNLAPGQE